jgi:hypothetical protein
MTGSLWLVVVRCEEGHPEALPLSIGRSLRIVAVCGSLESARAAARLINPAKGDVALIESRDPADWYRWGQSRLDDRGQA